MRVSLRERLITVTVLAVAACVAALVSIVVLSRTGEEQRIERAREFVTQEVERLQDRAVERPNSPLRRIARRGLLGYLTPAGDDLSPSANELPTALLALRDEAFREASRSSGIVIRQRSGSAPRARRLNSGVAEGVAVLAVGPVRGVGYAWASTWVMVPAGERTSRVGVFALCGLTLALIVASLLTVSSVRAGVAQLRASLEALTGDLSARVQRPEATELAAVSDGITALAQALQRSVEDRAKLTLALAQRERLASLGRVVAGVAHEVRNPMAAIKLRVDLARQVVLSPRPDLPGVSADLAEVTDELSRLDRLVADLLVVSGRKLATTRPTDLRPLVEQRVQGQRHLADPRGVRLSVEGDARADVDVDRVVRAVDNLLRNAIEAAPEGSAVSVRLATSGAWASIEVRDQGAGVSPTREAELFEPFFTTKPEGTGLGLALSRAVAEAHGGTAFYRRDGASTVFTLTFPLRYSPEDVA